MGPLTCGDEPLDVGGVSQTVATSAEKRFMVNKMGALWVSPLVGSDLWIWEGSPQSVAPSEEKRSLVSEMEALWVPPPVGSDLWIWEVSPRQLQPLRKNGVW